MRFLTCKIVVVAMVAMACAAFTLASAGASASEAALVPFTIVADTIPQPLTNIAGDAARGRAIVTNRTLGLCLLCHPATFAKGGSTGNLAPSLDGTGNKFTAAQLRLRLVDSRRVNAESVMPSYYRVDGITRASRATQNKPILDAQQIEDVLAFLSTLK